MIKAVIFDMFETLVTHYKSPMYFGTQMAIDTGISEDKFLKLWKSTEIDRTIGNLTLEEVLEMIFVKNQCYSKDVIDSIIRKRVEIKKDCFKKIHPEIVPLMEILRKKNLKIGLISNCFSEEVNVIRECELFKFFDSCCLSFEMGIKKPDPEIYIRCMKNLNVKANECLYVGDGGSSELEAAQQLGINTVQAIWYINEHSQQSGIKEGFIHIETPLKLLEIL